MTAVKGSLDAALVYAEQSVLGALMLAPDALGKVVGRIDEQDFSREDHRLIWRAINELANKGTPCDAVTLEDWFESNGVTEEAGGAGYPIELANNTPSAANVSAYADIVRESAARRRLADSLARTAENAMQLRTVETRVMLQSIVDAVPVLVDDGLTRVVIPAVGEVLPPIDFVLPGLEVGSVGLMVGEGAVGKTMLAMEIAISIASGHAIAEGPAGALFGRNLQRGNVTLICGEDSPTIVGRRIAEIADAYRLTSAERAGLNAPGVLTIESAVGADLRCLSSGRRGEYVPGPFLPRLRQYCVGRRLVIVDPLAFLHDSEERDNGAMTQLMRRLAWVARESGAALIVIHHAGKPSTGGTADAADDWARARGASALTTASRVQYFLRGPRADERRALGIGEEDAWRWCRFSSVKTNHAAQTAPAWLQRGHGGVLSRCDPAPATTAEEYSNRRGGSGGRARAGAEWASVRRRRTS